MPYFLKTIKPNDAMTDNKAATCDTCPLRKLLKELKDGGFLEKRKIMLTMLVSHYMETKEFRKMTKADKLQFIEDSNKILQLHFKLEDIERSIRTESYQKVG